MPEGLKAILESNIESIGWSKKTGLILQFKPRKCSECGEIIQDYPIRYPFITKKEYFELTHA